MKFVGFATRAIEYLFYSLFLLVPLVFAGNTSELFEFNKMWLTFIIAILIGFFWFSKMLATRSIIFKRTVLDIPILIFLGAHILSSLISIDMHISIWGYYSRWNGGLLSIITYIFLYWAFVSNFASKVDSFKPDFLDSRPSDKTVMRRSLIISVISGLLAVLWAIPSHFGYDPTCLVFRGELNVACWTNDFQPTVRIFGSLGQPNWLAGYLGILIPITLAFIITRLKETKKLLDPWLIFYTVSFLLFYLSLLYTGAKSGMIAVFASLIIFGLLYIFVNRKDLWILKNKVFIGILAALVVISFLAGIRLPVAEKFSLSKAQQTLVKEEPAAKSTVSQTKTITTSIPLGGSDSGKIREVVWKGAINVWKANPILGSGVETFAFAYYGHRPIEHNKLSEWNFLYNKAHNEFLNYLATTGIVGFGAYLLFILTTITLFLVNILNIETGRAKFLKHIKAKEPIDNSNGMLIAFLSSFISILIVNFFGFSVVISNIYLFLIPAFGIILLGLIKDNEEKASDGPISYVAWSGVFILGLIAVFMIGMLGKFWLADVKYALGSNYNRAGEYQLAYPLLQDAVNLRQEPVFLDEKAINNAFIAVGLAQQQSSESAALANQLATEALRINDKLVTDYPNNVNFWKSRVRVLYTLSNIDAQFLPLALQAIEQTSILAPTDTSVLYNWGVIVGQSGDTKKAVEVLEKTVKYRPNYTEARYALGLFYHDLAVNDKGVVIDTNFHTKAINEMKYILENLDSENSLAKESLTAWEKEF